MKVLTKDGWSTRADWRFRSAGGEVEFTIGMVEDNLLGTASSAAVRYRKTPDRSTVALGFRRPAALRGPGRAGAGVREPLRRPAQPGLALEQPFYSLTSPLRLSLRGRGPRRAGAPVLRRQRGRAGHAPRRYTLVRGSDRVGAAGNPRRASSGWGSWPRCGATTSCRKGPACRFRESVTGAFGPYLAWNRAQFLVTQGVAGFAREEDVDLGTTVRAGRQSRAEGLRLRAERRRAAGRRLGSGRKIPGGFGYLEALAGGLYTSAGLDSGVVQLAATGVTKPVAGHVAVAARGGRLAGESAAGRGVRPRAWHRSAGVPKPRLHRRPHRLRHGRVPGDGGGGLPRTGGTGHRGLRGPRRGVVRGHTAPARMGCGARASGSARAAPSDTEALRFDLARRFAQRCAGRGLGGDRRERASSSPRSGNARL